MMNDDLRDMMPTSEEFYADAKAEFGEVVQPDTHAQDVVDHTTGNNPEYNAYLDAFNLTPIAEYLPNNK